MYSTVYKSKCEVWIVEFQISIVLSKMIGSAIRSGSVILVINLLTHHRLWIFKILREFQFSAR